MIPEGKRKGTVERKTSKGNLVKMQCDWYTQLSNLIFISLFYLLKINTK